MEIVKKTPATTEEKKPMQDRIVMLSDGVFAIAMTLLILDIRLPVGLPRATFQDALELLLPNFISYVISFISFHCCSYYSLISPNYVYFSWWVIYLIYFLLRRFQPRLFPKLTERSEQSAESAL